MILYFALGYGDKVPNLCCQTSGNMTNLRQTLKTSTTDMGDRH